MAIEFLTAEGSSLVEIHRRLRRMCCQDTVDIMSVRRWVRRFKVGEKDAGDRPCSPSAMFYVTGLKHLTKRRKKCVDKEGDPVEN